MEERREIDESFVMLHEKLSAFCEDLIYIRDLPGTVQMQVSRLEIDTPIEMDIVQNDDGGLDIGAVPPLYHLATTIEPVFHRIRFRIDVKENKDGK